MNQDEADRVRREGIAERAYEIYLARAGHDGLEKDDWLLAEREIEDLPLDNNQSTETEDEEATED